MGKEDKIGTGNIKNMSTSIFVVGFDSNKNKVKKNVDTYGKAYEQGVHELGGH